MRDSDTPLMNKIGNHVEIPPHPDPLPSGRGNLKAASLTLPNLFIKNHQRNAYPLIGLPTLTHPDSECSALRPRLVGAPVPPFSLECPLPCRYHHARLPHIDHLLMVLGPEHSLPSVLPMNDRRPRTPSPPTKLPRFFSYSPPFPPSCL